MLIIKLYRFLIGKVKLKISGDFSERILNLCSHNGIAVWGIRKKHGAIYLYMSVRDFKSLRRIVRGSGLRIRICKKRGTPFIVNRYRNRYGIVAGTALFFALLQFLSGFVWNIDVSGNKTVDTETIVKACSEIGIKEGVRAKKILPTEDKIDLQLTVDGLGWGAINIEGSVLTVNVTETETPQKDDKVPRNLIADSDGIIKSIEANVGTPAVSAGQAVTKGDLLVSGVVELKSGTTHFVASDGIIIAEVSEKYVFSIPLKQTVKTVGKNNFTRFALSFFGIKIPLFLDNINGEYLKSNAMLKIQNNGAYLPIYLYRTEFEEIEKKEVHLSEEEALKIARDTVNKRVGNSEILSRNEKTELTEGNLVVETDITLLKDIAIKEKILFSATN